MTKDEIPTAPRALGAIAHKNFFLSTRATFVQCAQPEGVPDYVSDGGSCYWHKTDENGDFVIRKSDHWCEYYTEGERKIKRFRARIRSCSWHLIIHSSLSEIEIIRFGKCYLKEFDRIEWRTKRRYDVIN